MYGYRNIVRIMFRIIRKECTHERYKNIRINDHARPDNANLQSNDFKKTFVECPNVGD